MVVLWGALLGIAIVHAVRLRSTRRTPTGGVLVLSWRDTSHPQGGGSEVFVEEMATRLASLGRPVTVFCAAHPGAPREEVREGVRFLRRGAWWSVYAWAAVYGLRGRLDPYDVVLDVQNGVPFFARLWSNRPVVVVVHHVHREQWSMFFGRRLARAGWWVESRLAPWVYRGSRYVTVSEATRADLALRGVQPERVSVVRNGAPTAMGRGAPTGSLPGVPPKADEPTLAFLGRLVPHKRVELLLEAARALRPQFPDLRVHVIGRGAWEADLREAAARLGIAGLVAFEGYLLEEDKRRLLARSWALVLPSLREGWGLAVMDAAAVATPAVAFRVGGLQESIVDGQTGLLADTFEGFVEALRLVLESEDLRARLGANARARTGSFSWDRSARELAAILDRAVDGIPVAEPAPAIAWPEAAIAMDVQPQSPIR
jgi:glycosyltransferase involved in cell wall biosynthesis